MFCVVTPVLKQKSAEPGCCPLKAYFERWSQKHLPELCRQTRSTAEGADVSFVLLFLKHKHRSQLRCSLRMPFKLLASCSKYIVSAPPMWLSGKESACQAGDVGSISGSRRSPEEGNGNPLQDSCPENPMSRSLEIYSPESHKRVKYDLMTKYHFIF